MCHELGGTVLTSPVASFESVAVLASVVMWAYVVCLKHAVFFLWLLWRLRKWG